MKPVIERFLEKINVTENGCWEWTGAKINGYGEIKINYKFVYTHRFIYEYYYGSICPDLTLDHLCRNPTCCNPLHLEQVSLKENILRGIAPSAINSRKTHCLHGHLLSNDNLTLEKGRRRCKICLRDRMRLSRKLKKITN